MNNPLEIILGKIPRKEGYTSYCVGTWEYIEVDVGSTVRTGVRFYHFTLIPLNVCVFIPFDDIPWSEDEFRSLDENRLFKFLWPIMAKKITLSFLKKVLKEYKEKCVDEGVSKLAGDLKKLLDL